MKVATLAGLVPGCLSSHVILVETDRDLVRRDPRMVFVSAVEQWACEMAVGMMGSRTRDGGRGVVARLDGVDDGGPWCERASTTALLVRGGWQMRRTAKACACRSIGGGSEGRAHRGPRCCDFDLSEPDRLCWRRWINGDWRARGRGAATEVSYYSIDGRWRVRACAGERRCELGEDGPHTRTAAPS